MASQLKLVLGTYYTKDHRGISFFVMTCDLFEMKIRELFKYMLGVGW